jgi:hypothetical protein
MAREHVIQCPYCLDERNGRSGRKWWDYFVSGPWMLLGYTPRRCEHCYGRFWISPRLLKRNQEWERQQQATST